MGENGVYKDHRSNKDKILDDAAGALSVTLTPENVVYLEEPYVPHPIVGAAAGKPTSGRSASG